MNVETIIYFGGIYYMGWALFDLFWPKIFNWKETLAPLDNLNRILLHVTSKLLVVLYLGIAYVPFFNTKDLLRTNIGKTILIFISFFVIIIFESPLFAWSGKILDKETGSPIERAVIIRSWERDWATPAGTVSNPVTFEETLSDKDGKFNISIFKRILHVGVPLFAPISENNSIVFKPGYRFKSVREKTSIIELEKIPATYYLRYEEAEKARGNYQVDFHQTKLLKKMVADEVEYIKSLDKYVPSVWYTGFRSLRDIAIDQENSVFVADGYRRTIHKLSQKGKKIKIGGCGSGGFIDIEIDQSGNLYSFKGRTLYYNKNRISINGLPPGDVRFALGQNKRVFIIVAYKPFLFKYDLDGNLLCKQKIANKNSIQFEGDIQLIDIDSATDDMIIVAYSNVKRNGILIFDKNCNEAFYKEIDIDYKVRSIEAIEDGFVVADRDSIYVYDKNINLKFKEKMRGNELGVVDIYRISSDNSGTYLYVIESRYGRILKYNLKTREFCIR